MPTKALHPCPQPGCHEITTGGRCERHAARRAWQHSRRNELLGQSGWVQRATRRRILERDRGICYVCHQPGADQVDHVIPVTEGGTSSDDNLAAIHDRPCHKNKTSAEAARARARARQQKGNRR